MDMLPKLMSKWIVVTAIISFSVDKLSCLSLEAGQNQCELFLTKVEVFRSEEKGQIRLATPHI